MVRFAPDAGASGDWKVQHKELNGVALTVISSKPCVVSKFAAHCGILNYFTSEGVLRIHVASAVETLYNGLQPFQNLLISRSITRAADGGTIITISIGSLELLNPSDTELLKNAPPPADLQSATPTVDMTFKTTPKIMAAKLIHQNAPIYPTGAEQQHLQGTVVIETAIDETGKVREPFVIDSAGSLLDKSALDAVRQWRYSPPILNGAPVCVYTRISVVYRLNY
jgi:TonB family protein